MKLEFINLTHRYGDICALDHFCAVFETGIYGLLGPNGAGKSTLMNLLTDNLKRIEGKILFEGKDILDWGADYRKWIGYMPQQQGFYEQFSAAEFLWYIGRLKDIPKKELRAQIETLLKKVNLYEHRNQNVGSFSGGMRQRVLLAQALLGNPKILILDEPTAGLDPKERINLRNIIAEMAEERIVFIATHIVSDVECVANQVLLMKSGKLICMEAPSILMRKVKKYIGEVKYADISDVHKIAAMKGNIVQREDGLYVRFISEKLPENARPVEDAALEDVYMYYIEQEKTDDIPEKTS